MSGSADHYVNYVVRTTFEGRVGESARMKSKHPECVPVIIEPSDRGDQFLPISQNKYHVPEELTVGQLIYAVRKNIPKLKPNEAIFACINGTLPPTSTVMRTLYSEHKSKDGFLYIEYSGENTFGVCATSPPITTTQ